MMQPLSARMHLPVCGQLFFLGECLGMLEARAWGFLGEGRGGNVFPEGPAVANQGLSSGHSVVAEEGSAVYTVLPLHSQAVANQWYCMGRSAFMQWQIRGPNYLNEPLRGRST